MKRVATLLILCVVVFDNTCSASAQSRRARVLMPRVPRPKISITLKNSTPDQTIIFLLQSTGKKSCIKSRDILEVSWEEGSLAESVATFHMYVGPDLFSCSFVIANFLRGQTYNLCFFEKTKKLRIRTDYAEFLVQTSDCGWSDQLIDDSEPELVIWQPVPSWWLSLL
ncbi:hypothetical protein K2X40_01345 [Candidatus Babeliales bacterium]|nr:hypothetical protein [Candidatus Babeliales bacterium]